VSRRVRWEVAPAGRLGWTVKRIGMEMGTFLFKYRAVNFAAAQCRQELEHYDLKSELMIKNRNGRYDDPRTYGDDPPGSKG